jgi:hypothetical protein
MSKLKMEFYKRGVTFEWRWRNEKEYEAGKGFLEDLLGYPAMKAGELDFFYFESEQQFDSLVRFQDELERGAEPLSPHHD